MKTWFICIGLISLSAFAQTQIENGGFETWENLGAPEEEPTEWSSLKTADALAWATPVVCSRDATAPHSGSYCVRLENKTAFGVTANGLLTSGRVHADWDPENGNVFTNPADAKWNTPFTDRPDSLVGWFKYDWADDGTGADRGKVEVLLHDNSATGQLPDDPTPGAHWIGKARYDIELETTSWVRFSVPFTYYSAGTPDYLLIVCSAGDSTIANEGSVLFLDDLELIYNPENTVEIAPATDQFIETGTDGTLLTATEAPSAAVSREWKYSTVSGSGYMSFATAETGLTYLPNFSTAGTYFVICESDFGTESIVSNEVTIFVTDPGSNSVTISPASTQTILLGEDGSLLTANELPGSADSRDWKYSLTSGSGYVSFTVPETGINYLPNFDIIGTYYVICESDFSGDIQVSNEVTIHVPSAAGIHSSEFDFTISAQNDIIQIQCDQIDHAIFNLYTLGGKLVYQSNIVDSNTTFNVNLESGVYIYSVVIGGEIITGKLYL